MAVVQISRIQIRRGQKNQGSGLPQLASGEFGWAVDSQELYIGNGAVSEGAPAVGNTKVITQHDNIFEFANTYIYKPDSIVQTGPSSTTPIARNLQDRLDDTVSIRSFGCIGDGTECSDSFQRAIDQLYLNTNNENENSRVTLYVEPGKYVFNKPVYIPPYASIIGAGVDKTIITHSLLEDRVTLGPVFRTCNGASTIGNPSADSNSTYMNQARNIKLQGMTIAAIGPYRALRLESVRNSVFKELKLTDSWTIGDVINGSDIGIQLNSFSSVVTCRDNVFEDIDINGFSYAVESHYDITDNMFNRITVDNCGFGVVLGNNMSLGQQGQIDGPTNNIIKNSIFGNGDFGIERNAIWVEIGLRNSSEHNKFYNVGNSSGGYGTPFYSNIRFIAETNKTENDYFERSKYLLSNQNFINGTVYVPEVEGNVSYNRQGEEINVSQYTQPTRIFRLPGNTTCIYEIDYWYNSTSVTAKRQGSLTIMVDYANNDVKLVDECEYIGNSGLNENISFSAELSDENTDATLDTLVVKMVNSTTSDSGKLRFDVKTKIEQ